VAGQDKFFRALGQRIRALRADGGYSQEDMISFGFSARHWQQIEAGRPITLTTLLRICDTFDIRPERLLKGYIFPADIEWDCGKADRPPAQQNNLSTFAADCNRKNCPVSWRLLGPHKYWWGRQNNSILLLGYPLFLPLSPIHNDGHGRTENCRLA